jgi:outer membrane protein OmpA-like peptidoglycan-associated protein
MKLKNYITTGIILHIALCAFAQKDMQKKADKLFNNFAFVQATKAYHELIDNGINTDYATRKLADSYAFLRNPDSAVVYYAKAVKQINVPTEYYYNYSQALRGVKKYEESRVWMKRFKEAGGNIEEQIYLNDSAFLNSIFSAKKQYFLKTVNYNSKYSDFGALEHNGKIYFTSSRDEGALKKHLNGWDEEPFLNIYSKDKNSKDSLIGNKFKIQGHVNSVYHDGPNTISKDGKTMYFSRTDFIKNILGRNNQGISNLKIYKASLINDQWTNIEELPFNSNNYSNGHPALSPDETKLFFASDRPGGFGGSDIYYVDIINGKYGKPKNLGSIVNTRHNERFPFINGEGSLFFASDGHPGLGMLDIFGTVADSNSTIINVINLGTPINSSKDDFSFFMSEDGLSGYFASNRKGGVGSDDIYAFDRIPLLTLEGTVYDELSQNPISNAKVTLLNENDFKIATLETNENGLFNINIDRDANFSIKINKEGHAEFSKKISSKNIDIKQNAISMSFTLSPNNEDKTISAIPDSIELSPIFFNFNSSEIRNEDIQVLDNLIHIMINEYPNMKISIASFTDARGPASYNYKLSQMRAFTTYNYLVNNGISPERIIEYKGFGEEHIGNGCNSTKKCTEAQHQANRRTSFKVIK